jgi:hypothetical protein
VRRFSAPALVYRLPTVRALVTIENGRAICSGYASVAFGR